MVAGAGQFGFDPLGDFYDGRKTGNAMRELQRADQARPLIGAALQGDGNALKALAGLDNGAFMDVTKFQGAQAAAADKAKQDEFNHVAGALYAADTPQKWQQTVQYLKQRGHQFDPGEEDFANRDAVLAEAQTLKEQMAQGNADRTAGIAQQNADTSRINSGKTVQTGGKPPSGYRYTPDGNLEPITGGPADPKRKASQGAGGVTTKMHNDAVAVNQAYNNLSSGLDDYAALIKKTGTSVLPGADSDALRQSRTNLQLQLKELYNLGVLNGPDLGLMQQMIFDPSISVGSPIDAAGKIYSGLGGMGSTSIDARAKASIDRVKSMLKTIRDNKTKGILDENGNFVGGNSSAPPAAAQDQSYPGGDGITEADLPGAMQDAQDAISQGADPQAVIDELVKSGVDPAFAETLRNGQ
jgi:hypothetical protein